MNEDLKDRLLERTRKMLDATVDEVMTREVMTVDAGDLAAKAARYILENGFLGLLVMKDGRPQNMVTAFELLRLSYEEVFDENRDFMRMKIGDLIADKEFVSVRSGTRLRDVLNLMCDRHVRSVPVIDEGLVRGIVSMPDLVRWYRDTHDEVRTGKL